jgi:hypothetical protein
MDKNDENKTYDFLIKCVLSEIKVQEQKRNMLEKEQLLMSRHQKPPEPVVPAKDETGKGKDKSNRNGKNGSRNSSPTWSTGGSNVMFETPDANSQTGRGKGKGGKKGQDGKGKKGQTNDSEDPRSKIACFFHQQEGGCRLGNGCPFKHTKLSEQETKPCSSWINQTRTSAESADSRKPTTLGQRGKRNQTLLVISQHRKVQGRGRM